MTPPDNNPLATNHHSDRLLSPLVNVRLNHIDALSITKKSLKESR